MPKNLWKIVITGGPVGGKDEGIKEIKKRLWQMGIRPFVVDEVATQIFGSGVPDIGEIARKDLHAYSKIQGHLCLKTLSDLRHFENIAREEFPNEKCVILLNRGPMDFAAYVEHTYAEAILREARLTLCDVRDDFDGVIHMQSTADGAEEVWRRAMANKENEARWEEKPEQARAVDARTKQAWIGTPHLRVIDNSTDWPGKMERLWKAVLHMLEPKEIERKFLLWGVPKFPPNMGVAKVYIEQMYLAPWRNRIRKRGQDGSFLYYLTEKIGAGLTRKENEAQISPLEYLRLSERRNPNTHTIRKHRYCFLFNNQYFECDVFLEPASEEGLCLLEIELLDEYEKVELPPFVKIRTEVTDDPAYSNYEIAKIK